MENKHKKVEGTKKIWKIFNVFKKHKHLDKSDNKDVASISDEPQECFPGQEWEETENLLENQMKEDMYPPNIKNSAENTNADCVNDKSTDKLSPSLQSPSTQEIDTKITEDIIDASKLNDGKMHFGANVLRDETINYENKEEETDLPGTNVHQSHGRSVNFKEIPGSAEEILTGSSSFSFDYESNSGDYCDETIDVQQHISEESVTSLDEYLEEPKLKLEPIKKETDIPLISVVDDCVNETTSNDKHKDEDNESVTSVESRNYLLVEEICVEHPDSAGEASVNYKHAQYAIIENDIKLVIKELLEESNKLKEDIIMHGVKEETEPPFYLNDIVNDTEMMECPEEYYAEIAIQKNSLTDVKNELQKVTYDIASLTYTNSSTAEIQNTPNCEDIQSILNISKFNRNDDERHLEMSDLFFNGNESTLKFSTPAIPDVLPNTQVFFEMEKNLDRINNFFLLALYKDAKSFCWLKSAGSTRSKLAITDGSETSSSESQTVPLREKLQSPASLRENNLLYVELPSTSKLQNVESIPDTTPTKRTGSKTLNCCNFRKHLQPSDNEDLNLRNVLPNLRYTCVSKENINSQEEIERIEKNIDENDKLRRY